MHIVISVLEKYCLKNGTPIHISFDTDDETPSLAFTMGEYELHGNTRVFLSNKEIEWIQLIKTPLLA